MTKTAELNAAIEAARLLSSREDLLRLVGQLIEMLLETTKRKNEPSESDKMNQWVSDRHQEVVEERDELLETLILIACTGSALINEHGDPYWAVSQTIRNQALRVIADCQKSKN
tara:strand:+ start:2819 stop:3160 length:342 start_codon:yes stop_codon:yes gene_type:complete